MGLTNLVNSVKKDISNIKLFFDSIISCGEHVKGLILYPKKKLEIKMFPHTPQSYVKNLCEIMFDEIKKR